MAFVPTFYYCLDKDNDGVYQLSVDDTTDVYDVADNPTGWEDASTLLAADVVTATLAITDPNGTTTTIDVLSQIPNPVIGEIEFTDIGASDGVSIEDGFYKIVYTITDATTTYTACVQKYFYPAVKCCISKLVKEVQDDPLNTSLYETLVEAKALEAALQAAAEVVDKETADKMLTLLQDYCDYNPCGCK